MSTRSIVEDRVAGDVDLTVGQDTGTVAVAMDSAPSRVFLTVESPDGSVVWATLEGDARDDGFDFSLSAAPATTGFVLHYVCDF